MDHCRCSLCLSICIEPVTAGCGAHNFCRVCIAEWITCQQQDGRHPTCPECRRPIQQDATQLRVNNALREAIVGLRAAPVTQLRSIDINLSDRILGRGATGEVVAGDWLGTPVAVKKMLTQSVFPEAKRVFQREINILSTLQHPNILRLYGIYELDKNTDALVLELGTRSLHDAIPRPGGMPMSDVVRIGLATARGLLYLHTRNPPVTHCDVKPANVIFDSHDKPMLADFNISHTASLSGISVGTSVTNVGGLRGTINYTAPENFDPDSQGYACTPSDIYGMGCVLFEMVTGSAPWTGSAIMAIFGKVCRGERPTLPPGLPPAMATLITECWAPDPSQRPSAAVVVQRLLLLDVATDLVLSVKTVLGRTNTFPDVKPYDTVYMLKVKIMEKEGIPPDQLRLTFATQLLRDEYTMAYYNILSGSIIMMHMRIVGDIGHFVREGDAAASTPYWTADVLADQAPGSAWLSSPTFPPDVALGDIAAMVRSIGGLRTTTVEYNRIDSSVILLEPARVVLMAMVDQAWADTSNALVANMSCMVAGVLANSQKYDFRLVIDRQTLVAVAGVEAVAAMDAALDDVDENITYVLRRTVAEGRWIGFHTDSARRTVQVPLSDDTACIGGRLVFAHADGSVTLSQRHAGTMLVHNGEIVHGVTRLIKGTRYGLFAILA